MTARGSPQMIEEEWERTESPTPLLEVQRRALLSDLFTSYGKYVEYWRAQNRAARKRLTATSRRGALPRPPFSQRP